MMYLLIEWLAITILITIMAIGFLIIAADFMITQEPGCIEDEQSK